MSTMNWDAPVFNYTTKYSTKLPSTNPFHSNFDEDSVAYHDFDYPKKLPSMNAFDSIPEEKCVPSQDAVCKRSAYNPFIAEEPVPESFSEKDIASKPIGAQGAIPKSFAAQEPKQSRNPFVAAIDVVESDDVQEPVLKDFVAENPCNDSMNTEELVSECELPTSSSDSKEIMESLDVDRAPHPLQNFWTLWYLENNPTKSWEDMQNEITTIGTVEDFWHVHNNIKSPSELALGCDYSFFKRGIRPMWEDAANIAGGRWVITLNKAVGVDLDDLWRDVLLCLIGESFDNFDEVCGAVVNIRFKVNKISIWTAHGQNRDAVLEIGTKLRNSLRLGRQHLQYQLHKDTMLKQSSNVRPLYVL